ncbi:hypothetical protein K443DRAFT_106389, partial [Laccaria amethystina LaAM-08-1]
HAHFQAITEAYDVLKGKTSQSRALSLSDSQALDTTYRSRAAWRTMRQSRQELYKSGAANESWKDTVIILGVAGMILIVLYETTTTQREVMAEVARSCIYSVYREYKQPQTERSSHQEAKPKS